MMYAHHMSLTSIVEGTLFDYHCLSPPIHLYLLCEISSLKNPVRRTGVFVYFELDFYCLCSLQKSLQSFFIFFPSNFFQKLISIPYVYSGLQNTARGLKELGSSACPLTSFFWLLSHVIYLKLTRVFIIRVSSFPKLRMSSRSSLSVSN